MCNSLHPHSEEIASEGIGWKLFIVPENKNLFRFLFRFFLKKKLLSLLERSYKSVSKGEVTWSNTLSGEDGFCFFLDEKEALIALEEWKEFIAFEERTIGRYSSYHYNYTVICLKIKYAGGIGSHDEKDFVKKVVRIGLCKKFSLFKKSDKYIL